IQRQCHGIRGPFAELALLRRRARVTSSRRAKEQVAIQFTLGLRANLQAFVQAERPQTLDNAIALAIKFENLDSTRRPLDESHYNKSPAEQWHDSQTENASTSTDTVWCNHCNKSGHIYTQCWTLARQMRDINPSNGRHRRGHGRVTVFAGRLPNWHFLRRRARVTSSRSNFRIFQRNGHIQKSRSHSKNSEKFRGVFRTILKQNWPYCLRCSAQCGSCIVYVRYNRQCRLHISTQCIFRFFNYSKGHWQRATDDIIAPFQSRRFIDTQTRDAFTSRGGGGGGRYTSFFAAVKTLRESCPSLRESRSARSSAESASIKAKEDVIGRERSRDRFFERLRHTMHIDILVARAIYRYNRGEKRMARHGEREECSWSAGGTRASAVKRLCTPRSLIYYTNVLLGRSYKDVARASHYPTESRSVE
ncbi:unnamed protein product, partial [Trichogramma brassicae]